MKSKYFVKLDPVSQHPKPEDSEVLNPRQELMFIPRLIYKECRGAVSAAYFLMFAIT